ncbi:hypothetical protein HPB47_026351 [Ixodes persulcatus]|uniref:Uncharacterized protein n=1 Tax=Ixodes persulcatus TaxID=34615 RepID=A0AC60PYY7_IXOPE|nr:hypothetical protein HPB47_026351 [Ixodes persulcatus]
MAASGIHWAARSRVHGELDIADSAAALASNQFVPGVALPCVPVLRALLEVSEEDGLDRIDRSPVALSGLLLRGRSPSLSTNALFTNKTAFAHVGTRAQKPDLREAKHLRMPSTDSSATAVM